MVEAFSATQEIYGRHFNQSVSSDGFPNSIEALNENYSMQFADKEVWSQAWI